MEETTVELPEGIGKIIKREREKLGWSQKKLADMVPMSQTGIQRLESEEYNASKKINKVLEVLGLDPLKEEEVSRKENNKESAEEQRSECLIKIMSLNISIENLNFYTNEIK